MKTSNLKTVIFLLFLFNSNIYKSQSLSISGKFLNSDLLNVTANYTLICEKIITVTGRGSEIEAELQLNKNYSLIIGTEKTTTEIITFSTNTDKENNFLFDFELILKDIQTGDQKEQIKKLFVYFNPKKNLFEYNRIKISRN
jgi:hypothetical protein